MLWYVAWPLKDSNKCAGIPEGGVNIMGESCPRSDPDIAHMRYYVGPVKLKYVMTYSHNVPLGMGSGIF